MSDDVKQYIASQAEVDRPVCERLQAEISAGLPEAANKVWHGHPADVLEQS